MLNYISVVIIDDDEEDFLLTKHYLESIPTQNYSVQRAASYDEALQYFSDETIDVFLVDYKLGKYRGIDILNIAKLYDVNVPFIIITGKGNLNIDKEAMKAGAADYLIKDELSPANLERSIRYSIERFGQMKIIESKEKKYKNIFDKSGDIILLTNHAGKIIDANPCAVKKFEMSKEELMNNKILNLIEENAQLRFWELVITNSLQGEVFSFYSGHKKRLLGLVSYNEQDEFSYQFIIHDVTKISIKEKEKREEEKFIATGRIARVIAHEVKNPLTNINFAVNELKGASKTQEKGVLIDIIERNCHRINTLINELLTSTKFSKLYLSKYNINQLITETIDLAKDTAEQNNVSIKHSFEEIDEIFIDPDKIKVALLNIIINAIEAIENDNGEVHITSSYENNKVIITISDNGKGIKKENLSKLFEAFYTENKLGGTGLGLTTTQNILLSHEGAIDVESEEGIGTTFTITLQPSELMQLYNARNEIDA